MKTLSVSDFKARISACLRDVEQGETYVITEHRRPVAEVRRCEMRERIVTYSPVPFSLAGIRDENVADAPPSLARDLINEDRGE